MNRTQQKDLQGYAFIRQEVASNGAIPSLRVIGSAVGYSSPRSVQLMLERLKKRGFLSYSRGVIRLRLRTPVMSEETVDVPLVGSVACGLPSLAQQDPEAFVQISTKIARRGHTYFLLRARGSSMNKAGINDGDLVLVRKQATAKNGDRVVALVDHEETIKHFHHEGNIVVLRPNSTERRHKPIILSDTFVIQGIVVSTFPNVLE